MYTYINLKRVKKILKIIYKSNTVKRRAQKKVCNQFIKVIQRNLRRADSYSTTVQTITQLLQLEKRLVTNLQWLRTFAFFRLLRHHEVYQNSQSALQFYQNGFDYQLQYDQANRSDFHTFCGYRLLAARVLPTACDLTAGFL